MLLLLTSQLSAGAKSVTVGDIVYSVNTSNGRAQATGLKDGATPSSITVKQTVQSGIEQFTVTSIGNNAFNYSFIKSVKLPNTIETIGTCAFKGSGITSITLPANLRIIGKEAFANTPLTAVTIPANVEIIRAQAFQKSGLKTITFAAGTRLNEIGDLAFNSSGLTAVSLPASLSILGSKAFYEATSLASVTIAGGNLTTIPSGCFSRCTALKTLTIGEGITTIAAEAFWDNRLTTLNLPHSLRTIGDDAFSYCCVVNLVIPEGVETIGAYAFSDSKWEDTMKTLVLPSTLRSLGNYAFENHDKLDMVTVNASTPPAYGTGAFGWNNEVYTWLNVHVYSMELYKAAAGWKEWKKYKDIENTGLETIADNAACCLHISAIPGGIKVGGSNGADIAVYDLYGRLAASAPGVIGEVSLQLPAGIYLVKCAALTIKAIVR